MASGYPDFEGGKQKVFGVETWSALVGSEVHINGSKNLAAFGDSGYTVQYAVPAGKTFYVTQFYVVAYAQVAANAELPLPFRIDIESDGAPKARAGGNYGDLFLLPVPVAVDGGDEAKVLVVNLSNHAVTVIAGAIGYVE